MEYWRGYMDWPLDKDWKCPTCNENAGLEWGLVHAQCRCNNCHTEFTMRQDDEQRTIVKTPICTLKDEYKEPIRQVWQKYHIPLEEVTEEQLNEFMVENGIKGG